jgi:nicotinate-nucleotide adenylyltransferase
MRIGILGGTFNPVHLGHLLMAMDAREQARLDLVEFIPCHTPPHKRCDRLVPAHHRVRMLQHAIRGMDGFRVNDIEVKRAGRSYSVDTLTELHRQRPGAEWFFIIGSDSLHELPQWRDFNRLKQLCQFIVVARPGDVVRHSRGIPIAATIAGHACAISSRDIRKRIARGLSIDYLVPDRVRRHIKQHHLYR